MGGYYIHGRYAKTSVENDECVALFYHILLTAISVRENLDTAGVECAFQNVSHDGFCCSLQLLPSCV
jgi:hypothetical protein